MVQTASHPNIITITPDSILTKKISVLKQVLFFFFEYTKTQMNGIFTDNQLYIKQVMTVKKFLYRYELLHGAVDPPFYIVT